MNLKRDAMGRVWAFLSLLSISAALVFSACGENSDADGDNGDGDTTCTPGEKTCVGNEVSQCSADGQWVFDEDCGSLKCAGGECIDDSDPCNDFDCSLHGECLKRKNGEPYCFCNSGYHANSDFTECLLDGTDGDADTEEDIDYDYELNSCEGDGPVRCEMLGWMDGCVQFDCADGMEKVSRHSAADGYGFCGGPDNMWCVKCTDKVNGGVKGCDRPWPVETTPEGWHELRYDTVRGYLKDDPAWSDKLKAGEKRLSQFSIADGIVGLADVEGNYAVWCHSASGRLFLYDIANNWSEELDAPDEMVNLCYNVTIENKRIYTAGHKVDESSWDIFEIDIEKKLYRNLRSFTGEAIGMMQIQAEGGNAVWEQEGEIALLNLDTKQFSIITDDSMGQYRNSPYVTDRYVIWSNADSNTQNREIRLYDISNGAHSILAPESQESRINRLYPVVNDTYAAWGNILDDVPEGVEPTELILYKLSEGKEEKIETTGQAARPFLDGQRLFWDEGARIRIRDLDREETIKITDETVVGGQFAPRASGRWLIYSDQLRFPYPDETTIKVGSDVILFDLCTLDWYKDEEMCTDSE